MFCNLEYELIPKYGFYSFLTFMTFSLFTQWYLINYT